MKKIIIIISIMLSGLSSAALACSCIPLDQSRGYIALLHEEVAAASAVVQGTVEALKEEGNFTVAMLRVDKAFTSDLSGSIQVRSASETEACGYPFVKEGARHLLYIYENDDGVMEVNVCGRSRPLDEARRAVNPLLDMELLGHLKQFAQ